MTAPPISAAEYLARGRRRFAAVESKSPTDEREAAARSLWNILLISLALVPFIWTIASRNATGLNDAELADKLDAGPTQHLVRVALNAGVLGLAGLCALLGSVNASRERKGMMLWLGAMALYIGPLVSSFVAPRGDFHWDLIVVPAMFTAVFLMPSVSLDWVIQRIKAILLFYTYGSLAAAVLLPQWAVQAPYTAGVIPGLTFRLHGVASHANSLGPLLLTYLLLDSYDFRLGVMPWCNRVLTVVCLVLSQSKTNIGAFMLIGGCGALLWCLRAPTVRKYVLLIMGSLVVVGGGVLLATREHGPAQGNANLETVSGRLPVWQITLDVWRPNPWFGYGQGLWDTDMQLAYYDYVGWRIPPETAHNQVLQSLGESGLVGVAGLALYLAILFGTTVKLKDRARRLGLSMVVALILLGFSEAIFVVDNRSAKFVTHVLMFAVIMLAWRAERRPAEVDPLSG
jgi:O-antigen ligase